MGIIRKLPQNVADMIAAGEVVERPGSVVKELLENAIDAGATAVTVEIQRGGMSYIRITDDGCGMSPEDARVAFLRHATSKLRDENGLAAIHTLGFRGEALAAISAVSRVELLTRERGSVEGTALTLEAGEVVQDTPVGCPEGTTIIVRDLFFNTPARLKFMKKDSAEGTFVTGVVTRCALSHPELSIRYIRDGKEELYTAGDGKLESCVYALFGADFAKNLLPVGSERDGIRVTGVVTTPAAARGSRSAQYFFVNGRVVKSLLLQSALEQAFKNSLFTGRFPGCVLYLELKHSTVDVNVHPAKTEVKFQYERPVFDVVYHAVFSALQGENRPPELRLPEKKPVVRPAETNVQPAAPKKDFFQRMTADEFFAVHRGAAEKKPAPTILRDEPLPYNAAPQIWSPPRRAEPDAPVAAPAETVEQQAIVSTPQAPEADVPAAVPSYRIVGEVFKGYILVEREQELLFIDKHAAHERMLFDRLKQGTYRMMSQQLMEPVVAEPGRDEAEAVLGERALFEELGFKLEDFGGGALLLRAVPADIDMAEAAAALGAFAAGISLGKKPGGLGVRDELLATMACKAAIKAGRASDPREWKPVVEAVLRGDVKYCPHGRPVSMTLTKSQIDRNFKRT